MTEIQKLLPNSGTVKKIVQQTFGERVLSCERFTTGNCHYVFDVVTGKKQNIVVRIAHPENTHILENAVYWNKLLRAKNIPLPEILALDLNAELSYLILERFPGRDLNFDYEKLSEIEKRGLAKRLTEIQTIVSTMPQAKGYGFLPNYETDSYCKTWTDVLQNSLQRSRRRIKSAEKFAIENVDRVEEKLEGFKGYFSQIQPVAFLDDITTKNVIVNDGKLSGIVDVDWLCFGDHLLTIALTRMSLLLSGYDLDYIDFWCGEMKLNEERKPILDFYTALFCVDFMSEIGQTFNKCEPLAVNNERYQRLHLILEKLLASI